jgi:hypothetical protein
MMGPCILISNMLHLSWSLIKQVYRKTKKTRGAEEDKKHKVKYVASGCRHHVQGISSSEHDLCTSPWILPSDVACYFFGLRCVRWVSISSSPALKASPHLFTFCFQLLTPPSLFCFWIILKFQLRFNSRWVVKQFSKTWISVLKESQRKHWQYNHHTLGRLQLIFPIKHMH